MSTFCGRMQEMDFISIDRFTDENLKSHAFFLSHCHKDHMEGIDKREFECTLQDNNAFLYMSSVSKTIIENMFPYLTPKIKVLDICKNFIDIPSIDKTIAVTLIPAGHCPGSVMFLFESEKCILYTGDIRLRVNELKKFNQLYDSIGNLKQIDNIYLDTTFFLKSFEYFPLREESISEFCNLINNWLEKDVENFISINTPARYGSEYLFIEISKRCKQPIHVSQEKYDVYKHFPEMDTAITMDEAKTRIHNDICFKTKLNNKYKLNVKPSALCWRYLNPRKEIVEKRYDTYHVCYSSHSSYSEIMEILKLLKPLNISPCVLQNSEKDSDEMNKTIENFLEEIHKIDSSDTEDSCELFVNKTNWTKNESIVKNSWEESNDENKDFFSILDSPRSKTKRHKIE